MQTQPQDPYVVLMLFSKKIPNPKSQGALKNSRRKDHLIFIKNPLALVPWKVTEKPWLRGEF